MSAFTRVILGLVLGVFTGLFFGELAGNPEIFGEAYIRLLQMTVLPYIMVSLIGGLDRLYDYWILGNEEKKRSPRWLILHNVFGRGELPWQAGVTVLA
jgi:CRISPR/Cas system CMR subunit Cmr6 (Cas7 group RAMP superfamily)